MKGAWEEVDVAVVHSLLVKKGWSLENGGTEEVRRLLNYRQSCEQIHNLVNNLKRRRVKKWKNYHMPEGHTFVGRQGVLMDSVKNKVNDMNCESTSVSADFWTLNALAIVRDDRQKNGAGKTTCRDICSQIHEADPHSTVTMHQVTQSL